MSKANGVSSAIGKIVTYILVVLLVLGIAGVAAYFVAKDEGISFYVEFGKKRYLSGVDEANISVYPKQMYSFPVKSLTGENIDYSVSVSSNGEHNFAFVYDGKFYDFYVKDDTENNDYSEAFGLRKNADGFSITLPEKISVERIIEAKFGGEIQLQKELNDALPYFTITVVSGENSLRFYVSLCGEVTGIELDIPLIIF